MAIGIFYQWPHSFDYRRSADRQPLKETQTLQLIPGIGRLNTLHSPIKTLMLWLVIGNLVCTVLNVNACGLIERCASLSTTATQTFNKLL